MPGDVLTITFPMVMFGILSLAGTILGMLVRKWINDSEKEKDTRDKEVHDSFRNQSEKADDLAKRIHELEIEMERRITRDELKELRNDFKADTQNMADNIIAAVHAGNGKGAPQ